MRDTDILWEQKLLANIILEPDIWVEIASDFNSKYFSDPGYQIIAEVIEEIGRDGKLPSSPKIFQYCREKGLDVKGEDLLEISKGFVTAKETKALLEELIDLYKRRAVINSLQLTLFELRETNKPTGELVNYAQKRIVQAFDKIGRSEVATAQDVAEEVFALQMKAQAGEEVIYPSSLIGLNTHLGGYELGSLNIIAARPSMGKTSLALHEALYWSELNLPGIFFSLEQAKAQLGQRILANKKRIPLRYIRGKLDDSYLDDFNEGLSLMRELPIVFSDRRGLNVGELCAIARSEKMKNSEIKWIVVDYLQCLEFAKGPRRDLEVGGACKTLRNLAQELNVWIVLLSQLNRGLENRANKRPLLADLRDSGNIEEFADSVMFLYREGYYRPNFIDAEMGNWVTEIELAKNRQGGSAGKKTLAMFHLPFMWWEDCPSNWAEHYKTALRRGGK